MLVLFDVDGTLLESGDPVHFGAYSAAMREVMGIEAEIPVKFTAGQTDRRTLIKFLEGYGFSRSGVEARLLEMFAVMKDYYRREAAADMSGQVIGGVRELLQRLRNEGFVLGLISGGVGEIVWEKMRRAGLVEFFSMGVFGDESEERAELVRLAISDKWRKDQVVIVGDTPRDIECARENGIRVIAVATGPYTAEELAEHKPDYLLADLGDQDKLVKILDEGKGVFPEKGY